jgi:hypothetical protein
VSELRDRLEALATRGTRRGADDVLRAAQQDAETGMNENTSDHEATDMEIIDDDLVDDGLPVVTMESRSRKRKRFGSVVASAGIAALVGVGALAITAMIGSGGADSPEGAVRQLAEAVSHKDPLAAVDVLMPSEVRSMRESVKNITKRAADLRIVNEASKPLEGVNLAVNHLELKTEPLADGYAKVVITSGEFSAETHRAQVSPLLQKAWRDGQDGSTKTDLSRLTGDSGLDTFVVVVRQGGGWYVSPAYTALEYIREANHYPAADFGSAKAKNAELGADTPQAAVEDALHAWQASNWSRLIALAPPDELPIYDYRAMIAASATDTEVDFSIDHLSTTATESGDTAIVKLDASGTTGSDGAKWQVGGSCASFLEQASNSDSGSGLCLSGDLAGTVPFGLMMMGGSAETPKTGPISISAVREGGRWFVSPVTTVLDVVDATVRNIDQRSVYTLLGLAYELPPDGTITLDQPFDVATNQSYYGAKVYEFEGKAGQQVIGEFIGPKALADQYSYVYGTIYSADGELSSSVDFQSVPTGLQQDPGYYYGSSAILPKTGKYRLVVEPYSVSDAGSVTLTLWDLAHAPEVLRQGAQSQGFSKGCGSSGLLGGAVECRFSEASGSLETATTSPRSLSGATPTTFGAATTTSSGFSQSSSGTGSVSATTGVTPPTAVSDTTAPAAPLTTIGK